MSLCVKCNEKTAQTDPTLGVLPYCEDCRSGLSAFKTKVPEFVGENIKEQRAQYKRDIIQPHRKGELSREWLEGGKNRIERAKKMGFSEGEIKNAKYVWNDDSYYKKY